MVTPFRKAMRPRWRCAGFCAQLFEDPRARLGCRRIELSG